MPVEDCGGHEQKKKNTTRLLTLKKLFVIQAIHGLSHVSPTAHPAHRLSSSFSMNRTVPRKTHPSQAYPHGSNEFRKAEKEQFREMTALRIVRFYFTLPDLLFSLIFCIHPPFSIAPFFC